MLNIKSIDFNFSKKKFQNISTDIKKCYLRFRTLYNIQNEENDKSVGIFFFTSTKNVVKHVGRVFVVREEGTYQFNFN